VRWSKKGRTAIRVFEQFPYLKRKPYWGNHFWAPGYCVDTVGLDEEMIRKYVKYQERKERHDEQLKLDYQPNARVVEHGPCLHPVGASTRPPSGGTRKNLVLWAWLFTAS
jgi:hypothetical protein